MKEIGKLQTQIAKLKAEKESDRAKIAALEKLKVPQKTEPLSDTEIARRIAFLFNKGEFELVDGKIIQVRAPRGKS